jgi:hypothetical protein
MNNNGKTKKGVVKSSKKIYGRDWGKNGQSQMSAYEMIENPL